MSRLWPLQSTICRSPAFLSFALTFRKWRASDKRAAPFPAGAQSLDKCGFQAARFQFEHSRPAGPADLPEYPARRPPSRNPLHPRPPPIFPPPPAPPPPGPPAPPFHHTPPPRPPPPPPPAPPPPPPPPPHPP